MPKFKDLQGMKFNKLLVLERDFPKEKLLQGNRTYWKCLCDCGNEVSVCSSHLTSGHTTSCGCARKENITKFNFKNKKRFNKYDLSGKYGIGWTSNTNKEFYFDLEDYDKIKDVCWYENNNGYISGMINNRQILIHRFILGLDTYDKKSIIVDHIKHNTFDNRKKYLRIVSHIQNKENSKLRKDNKSGITGVYWLNRDCLWCASITVNYKTILLGYFKDFNEAVKARKEAEKKYFGEYSYEKSMNISKR